MRPAIAPRSTPSVPAVARRRARLAALGAVAVAALAAGVPTASADSIAYVKGGDVWLTTTDGARQFQVTTGGGYDHVAQADDGTLLASTVADSHLRRLDRTGTVLSDIVTPVSDHSPGPIRFQGPFDVDLSPNGRTAAYGYIESGLFTDGSGNLSSQTKNGAGFTRPDALTGFTDEGYKHSNDWDAPEFVDDQNVLLSNGPLDPYSDNVAVEQVGTGNPVNWFSDPEVRHPMEASISRNKLVLATVNGPERQQLYVYRDTNGKLGGTPGQPLNVARCFTYSGSGVSSPTFSADGSHGFWATADGVQAASFSITPGDCGTGKDSTTIAPGGTSPDWGPADVPAPRAVPDRGPAPNTGRGGATTPAGQKALRVRVGGRRLGEALRKGLVLRVDGAGAATATGKIGGRTVANGRATGGASRMTLRFSAKARRSLKAHRRVVLRIAVVRGDRRGTASVALRR